MKLPPTAFLSIPWLSQPAKDAKGFIKLQFTHDGQVFEDIFEFGYFNPKVRLKIEDNKVKVTVTNDTDSHLNGELALATPFETWSLLGFNTAARGGLALRNSVSLKPHSKGAMNSMLSSQRTTL